jgi:CubicO group peptidase (beta-lactamase class C family)
LSSTIERGSVHCPERGCLDLLDENPIARNRDRNIFQPLGMGASSVDRNVPGLAVPYGRRMPDGTREVLPFVDARGMAAATGITSNVEDMAKFVAAQFRRGPRGGTQIVSTGSLREMHRVRSVEENWTSGTGLGFDISRIKDRTYVGHGGGYPGNTTQTLIQLDDKVGVIVLTNTNDSNPADIARKLMATVGQAVAKASAPKPAAVAWDPACALRGTLPRARRRFARRAAESETGHHHAQRDERGRPDHVGAAWRRALPFRGAHGRRRGGRGRAFRGGGWAADADVHR